MKYTIGIDLGGTTMTAGLVDEAYNIVGKITRPTRLPRPAQDLEQALADLCRAVAKDCKIDFADVSYVGIGTPGSVNFTTGFVGYNTNFGYYDWNLGLTWKLCLAARSMWKTMPTQQHLANTSQAAQRASRSRCYHAGYRHWQRHYPGRQDSARIQLCCWRDGPYRDCKGWTQVQLWPLWLLGTAMLPPALCRRMPAKR